MRAAQQTGKNSTGQEPHRVVVIGGGFGGLYAAKALRRAPVKVTLVDRRNFHLFQPLLYQVATGGLAPGDIAYPLREIFKRDPNFHVIAAEVTGIDPDGRKVILRDGEIAYDTLIVATGSTHHYFGHDEWGKSAPGLKTVEDALEIRRRIFLAFETAERETEPEKRLSWMTFCVVGGGPTGVELAGSLGELVRNTLQGNFRNIDPTSARIFLLEADQRLLQAYPAGLAAEAAQALARLGVTVRANSRVTRIADGLVTLRSGDDTREIRSRTVIWCAGVRASRLGEILARRCGAEADRAGRILVGPDLTVPGRPEIFVIGDLANFSHQGEKPLPGLAPVAMQQGGYAADLIRRRLEGKKAGPFHYRDRGNLSVIGRNAAVVDLGFVRFSGFFAWLLWCFVHIAYLIGFDNKLLVLFQWGWNYFTRKRGARLITGDPPHPVLKP